MRAEPRSRPQVASAPVTVLAALAEGDVGEPTTRFPGIGPDADKGASSPRQEAVALGLGCDFAGHSPGLWLS